jgi:hypothetical protein
VVSDDEDGSYGHPDHIKAHAVTVRAVALAADAAAPLDLEPWQVAKRYVHTLSHGKLLEVHNTLRQLGLPSPFGEDDLDVAELPFGVPDDRVTTQIDVAGWIDRKRAAMAAPLQLSVFKGFRLLARIVGDAAGRRAPPAVRAADDAVPGGAVGRVALVRYFRRAARLGICTACLNGGGDAAVGRVAAAFELNRKRMERFSSGAKKEMMGPQGRRWSGTCRDARAGSHSQPPVVGPAGQWPGGEPPQGCLAS